MSIIKLSLPGIDVKSSRLSDEVIDSRYANPKIDTEATPPHTGIVFLAWNTTGLIYPIGTNRILYSFSHGYSYIPTAFAAYSFDSGATRVKGTLPFQLGALGIITIDTDATNVNIKYHSVDVTATAVPAFTMQIRFYVMAERGKE